MIALVGNPNSGKTTLFNKLTNSSEMVGNLSGVTVDKKIGKYKHLDIIDLPGIYSLIPYTKEEEITVDYINNNSISLILNVIDINSLNRSLYLTSRLMDLNIPIIIVLTKGNINTKINIIKLENIMGIDIIYIKDSEEIDLKKLDSLISKKRNAKNKFLFNNDIYKDIELRYERIDQICNQVIIKRKNNSLNKLLDSFLLNKFAFFIINILLFIFIYYVSINIIGSVCVNKISYLLNTYINLIINFVNSCNISIILKSLIIDGILKGISSIIVFIPQIIIILFLITLLEDSGYITRMSLMLDWMLKKIRLSGKSFHPLLLGSTCSVLGILSTRTIKNEKERLRTIFFIQFIPCSAKLTVIIFITSMFFSNSFIIFLSFYLLCILVIIISSFIFKKDNLSYIMEMPNLRIPSISNACKHTYYKIKNFFIRIITVIMFISIINWIFISFDTNFNYNVIFNKSILYIIGNKLSFLTGLFLESNRIRETIAIISGLMAKEQVVSTISVLGNSLNRITAYTFCTFNILTPCINTISVIRKECGFKVMIKYLSIYIFISYIISILIHLLLTII